jgi:2-hydroxychromene-2-carboxylate isomerase
MSSNVRIAFFKDSREPLIALLDQHGLPYRVNPPMLGVIMASGGNLEILTEAIAPLASVIVAFLNRPSRKISLTLSDNKVVNLNTENISAADVAMLVREVKAMTAFDTESAPKDTGT